MRPPGLPAWLPGFLGLLLLWSCAGEGSRVGYSGSADPGGRDLSPVGGEGDRGRAPEAKGSDFPGFDGFDQGRASSDSGPSPPPGCGDGVAVRLEFCLVGAREPVPFPSVRSLDLGDVDGDGRAELLATLPGAETVTVRWGGLPEPWTDTVLDRAMPDGGEAYRARFLDLDEDGHLDLMAVGSGSRILGLRGDGRGVFEGFDPELFPMDYGWRYWRWFRLQDLDGDGRSDLVGFRDLYRGASWGHAVYALRREDGAFDRPVIVEEGREADFGDLDHDGDLDIVLQGRDGARTNVAWQTRGDDGRPAFGVTEGPAGSSGSPVIWSAGVRAPARVVAGGRDVLLGLDVAPGKGIVAVQTLALTSGLGTRPWFPLLLDADGDGRDDLVVARVRRTRFALLRGRGDDPLAEVILADAGPSREVAGFGDVEGDGLPDAVFWSDLEGALRVVPLQPRLLRARSAAVVTPDMSVDQVMAGDVDGDGRDDLVSAGGGGPLRIHLSDGRGGFRRLIDVPLPGMSATGLAVGDLDGDGRAEVAAVGTGRLAIVGLDDQERVQVRSQLLAHGTYAVAIAAAPDATGDGRPDLYITGSTRSVHLYAGGEGLVFKRVWTGAHGGDAASVRAADMDGLGGAGCVVFGRYPATLTRAFINPGTRPEDEPRLLSLTARHVEVGDVDGDGRVDVVGGAGGGLVTVAFARPDGSFRVVERQGDPRDRQSGVAVVDLDGDGQAEIVAPDLGTLVVVKASYDPGLDLGSSPAVVRRIPKLGTQRRLVPADVNGDGVMDLWSVRSGRLVHAIFNRP